MTSLVRPDALEASVVTSCYEIAQDASVVMGGFDEDGISCVRSAA